MEPTKQLTALRIFIYSSLLTVALCLLTYFVFGIYYEEYESAFQSMFGGTFMEGIPWDNFFYMVFLGLGKILALLATRWPDVMWYDLLLAGSLWIAITVIFTCLWLRLQPHFKAWQIVLFNVALYIVFIADNVLNFQMTRTSFVVCGAAFVWFALILYNKPFKRSQVPAYIFCSLLFVLGVLIRSETGILLFGLWMVYAFARSGFSKALFLKLLPFLIPLVIIVASIAYDIATTKEHYKLVETGAEYQMSLRNVVGIEAMKTTEDSMRYVGLMGGIVNDPEYVPYSFIKSILAPKSPWVLEGRLVQRAFTVLWERLSRYKFILVADFLLLLLGVTYLFPQKAKLLGFLFYTACFWGLLFVITYKLKMEHRLLSPFLGFFTLGYLFLLFDNGLLQTLKKPRPVYLFTAFSVYLMLASVLQLNALSADYKTNIAFNRKRYADFVTLSKGKIVMPTYHVYKIMFFDNALPFEKQHFETYKKVFQLDMSAYSLIQPYRAYLDSSCHCNSADLGAAFDYFEQNKNDFVFAGTPRRIALFQSYLNIVHNRNYQFQRQTDFFVPSRTDVRDAEDTLSIFTFR